jgi:DNA-binding transcriptional MerR regulator
MVGAIEISEKTLKDVEKQHPTGISSVAILDFFAAHEVRFSEATLRKWVQLGLLPRSVRVGTKGKHQGSKGLYPVRAIRQILRIKEMMAQDLTIEEIQRQFLFVRGDVEALQQTLEKIFDVLERVGHERAQGSMRFRAITADVNHARALADELLDRIEDLERRLSLGQQTEDERQEAAAS